MFIEYEKLHLLYSFLSYYWPLIRTLSCKKYCKVDKGKDYKENIVCSNKIKYQVENVTTILVGDLQRKDTIIIEK